MVEAIASAGLPPPERNVVIQLRTGRIIVDLAWPEYRLAIELDGEAHHRDRFDEDRRRDVELKLAGWEVHRFNWKHATTEGEWMIRAIAAAVQMRSLNHPA